MDTQTQSPAERRIPNTGTTEAQWLKAVEDFKRGEPASSIARRLDLVPATVNAQLQKRGVYRRDHPVRRRRPMALEAATAGEPGRPPRTKRMPRLNLPPGADALAAADALEDWSQRLLRAGFLAEALDATRMARSKLLAMATRMRATGAAGWGGPEDEAETAGEPPTLREAQRPPGCAGDGGEWRTWLFLGGRGAGKTLAGAAWLAERAKHVGRLALVGPTLLDARDVMIEGPAGLRGAAAAFGPKGERPVYIPSRRRLVWSNGAAARVFSAEDPDSLRGPQFAAAWADEVCAWPKAEETLANLRMGLRLRGGLRASGLGLREEGARAGGGSEDGTLSPRTYDLSPQLMLSTTPRPAPWLRALLAEAGLAVTRGSALDNAEHLAPGFVEGLRALYGGTRLERQEVMGEVLDAPEGGVFRYLDIARARELGAGGRPERFERLVVAVDPPAGTASGVGGAACGIVVAGLVAGAGSEARSAWVLEDATAGGLSPGGWAARVAEAAARAGALGPAQVVAEANQGGEMVRQVLAGAGLDGRRVRLVHAALGKRARAEPVSLLYEQGRVAHAAGAPGGLEALEDQMLLLGAGEGSGRDSPDRADALVWALTELMLGGGEARVRAL